MRTCERFLVRREKRERVVEREGGDARETPVARAPTSTRTCTCVIKTGGANPGSAAPLRRECVRTYVRYDIELGARKVNIPNTRNIRRARDASLFTDRSGAALSSPLPYRPLCLL